MARPGPSRPRLRALVGLSLAVALAASASGCLGCNPTLDVRHCRPASETCAPSPGDRVADWNPDLANVFPDVARLLEEAPLGKHLHADWTEGQERAFWEFWDVPPEAEDKQVFLRHDGSTYRVRVLSC